MHCWYLENKFKKAAFAFGKIGQELMEQFPVVPTAAEEEGGRNLAALACAG